MTRAIGEIRKLAEGNKLLASGQELDEVCRHLEIAESVAHSTREIGADGPFVALRV